MGVENLYFGFLLGHLWLQSTSPKQSTQTTSPYITFYDNCHFSLFLKITQFQNFLSWSNVLPNFTFAAALVVSVSGQQRFRQGRTGAGNGYGAPPAQAQYDAAPATDSQSAAEPHGGDHQGLDWLLKSVPGQPGTDYPIFAEAPETSFICDGQVEGGKICAYTFVQN